MATVNILEETAMVGERLAGEAEGVHYECGVPCTLRDGTVLVADVYTPPGEGSFPVLLMRQPYGRDIASTVVYAQPTWFARQGYLVVVQDVRGRGDSEGAFHPFVQEAEDGYDSVQWAAALPKANGRVGMYGFSYQGSTQLLAAKERPPALVCLAPHMTAFDLYSGWFYRGGLLQAGTTTGWGNQMLREDAKRLEAWGAYEALERAWASPGALARRLPLAGIAEFVDEGLPGYARDWLEHDTYDAYWEALNLLKEAAAIARYPVFHLAGWYDFYLRGSMDGYRALHEEAPERQFLVVGPWGHIPWGTTVGGRDLGPAARLDTDRLLLRWLDRWLKGDASAAAETSGVKYFVMGANDWREAPRWPPLEAVTRTLYLASQGNANARFGDGALCEEAVDGPPDRFNYDPEVPVLAPNGGGFGPGDLSAGQEGNNLLVYTGEVVKEPFILAGQPHVRLTVQSSAEHTAFVARLSKVSADGREAMFLSLGAVTVGPGDWREDSTARLEIVLDDIACAFAEGERPRLDLASSAFPLLARHPNTETSANRVASAREFRRALQVVFHDEARPSTLTFSAIPA